MVRLTIGEQECNNQTLTKPSKRWQDKSRGPDRPQRVVGVEVFPGPRAGRGPGPRGFLKYFNGPGRTNGLGGSR